MKNIENHKKFVLILDELQKTVTLELYNQIVNLKKGGKKVYVR